MSFIKSRPFLTLNLVTTSLTAAAAFGFELTAEQVAAVSGLTLAVLSLLVGKALKPGAAK